MKYLMYFLRIVLLVFAAGSGASFVFMASFTVWFYFDNDRRFPMFLTPQEPFFLAGVGLMTLAFVAAYALLVRKARLDTTNTRSE